MQILNEALPVSHLDGKPMLEEQRPFRRALQGETVTDVEMRYTRPDGADVILRGSAAPLRSPGGTITGAVTVYQDITALKDVERLKDEFLATASHDLRNPLATVKGLVQLLQRRLNRSRELGPEMLRESLATVERQVDRLGEMLDVLLDVSRIQMGRLDMKLQPVDLTALIAEVVENHRLLTRSHTLLLATDGRTVTVLAERARLLQVIENLIGNAIKYSPDGGVVEVSIEAGPTDVRVTVSDDGIGVSPQSLPHLFDRFYRTEAVRGRQLEGSGLGLYICRGIVEALGGQIQAESPGENQGTRIWFTLPRATGDPVLTPRS